MSILVDRRARAGLVGIRDGAASARSQLALALAYRRVMRFVTAAVTAWTSVKTLSVLVMRNWRAPGCELERVMVARGL